LRLQINSSIDPFMRQLFILAFLVMPLLCHGQKYTISGHIKDKQNGESLIGANIYNHKTYVGTSTNTYGFYSLTMPKDSIHLVFSYVGYEPVKKMMYLNRDTTFYIELENATLLQEIVVSAGTNESILESSQMSLVTIRAEQIKSMPTLLGEVDLIKALQLLPGVQSGNEGGGGLYVRGGGPDQNLILLDGVPVYNASHLFGFFSVFNSDAINNVQLIKGGFPARYGGRLSSVIDISMKEGNAKEFQGEGSIGLVSSKLTLEGPINKDRTSFLISGRRTYIDLIAYPVYKALSDNGHTAGYFFYDFNAKINHKFSNKDHLYLSAYMGRDKAYSRREESYPSIMGASHYREEFGIQWGNITSALRWNRIFNNKLFLNTTLTYSAYQFELIEEFEEKFQDGDKDFYFGSYLSGIEDLAFKMDFEFIPNPFHYLRFGGNIVDHTFKPGTLHYSSVWNIDSIWGSSNIEAKELAAYVENDHKMTPWLKVNYGMRYSGFYVDRNYYQSLQPRLSALAMLRSNLSLKASYASMSQFIHLLTNNGIGLPTDLWVPATPKIRPQNSHQYAIGATKETKDYEITVEGFYKSMENLIEYKEGATFLHIDQDWQNKVISGSGESYGAELFIQKSMGKTTGWLGYTLSWSNRKFSTFVDDFEKVEWFPYKYDRRHDISLTMVHRLAKNIDFSWSWVFGSGAAVSLPVSTYMSLYPTNNMEQVIWMTETEYYKGKNSFRMRDYHRLDFSISFRKKTKWGERTWSVGAYNSYNRKNPFFMNIGRDDWGDKKFVQYSLFPIIPSVNYSFKF
jgi:outer membrane receptor for ferrienterochelin and colicin